MMLIFLLVLIIVFVIVLGLMVAESSADER